MSKILSLTGLLLIVATIGVRYRLPTGFGVKAYDSEKTFYAELHNSLIQIDYAKLEWAKQQHRLETDIPSMDSVRPYLGKWTNTIERMQSLGVIYSLTSSEHKQSDLAVLTNGLYFQRGISRYYPSGTKYSLMGGWHHPTNFSNPTIVVIREFLIRHFGLIGGMISVAILVGVVVLLTRLRRDRPK